MWTRDAYSEACRLFEQVSQLPNSEQALRLAELVQDQPEVADCLKSLLESDRSADEEDFLGVTDDLVPTVGIADAKTTPGEFVSLPRQIGSYVIEDRIGAGGMGIVYKAFDTGTARHVALKVMRASDFASQDLRDRFSAEAQAAAKMRHQHIVPVYEVGQEGEQDFFTMAFIEGSDLRQELKSGVMSGQQAAALICKIAYAVDYLHQHGVIHRDIKPANILLDKQGQPLLTDFGVAKRLDVDISATSTGQMMGSVQYAAPEQVTDAKRAGPEADIYALGATLYECITGSPPFQGSDFVEVMSRVRQQMPAHPRQFDETIDADLAAICMVCLAKRTGDRYGSVKDLINDLENYLRHEPVSANTGTNWRNVTNLISYQSKAPGYLSSGAATWTLAVGFLVHFTTFLNLLVFRSHVLLWCTLGVWGIAAAGVGYRYHWSRYWELLLVERLSGILQATVNLGMVSLFLIYGPLSLSAPLDRIAEIYPPLCLLFAVAICTHGGFYSGRWLLLGGIYFPLAILIAIMPPTWGPLLFCVTTTIIAVLADRELRQDAQAATKT